MSGEDSKLKDALSIKQHSEEENTMKHLTLLTIMHE